MPLGSHPLPLNKVIVLYLQHKAVILVSRISHPKVAYPRLQWGLAASEAMARCLLALVPPVLTPLRLHLGSHWALEGTRGKHLGTSQWAVTFSKSRSKDNQLT